jgi:hypothetical protein
MAGEKAGDLLRPRAGASLAESFNGFRSPLLRRFDHPIGSKCLESSHSDNGKPPGVVARPVISRRDVVYDLEQVGHLFDFEGIESAFHDGFVAMSAQLRPLYGERDGVCGNIGTRVGHDAAFAACPDPSKSAERVGIGRSNAQDQVLVHEVLRRVIEHRARQQASYKEDQSPSRGCTYSMSVAYSNVGNERIIKSLENRGRGHDFLVQLAHRPAGGPF